MLSRPLLLLTLLPLLALAGGLQDLAAYPKYDVVFLNEHPLSASDAARARDDARDGVLRDDDFLDARPRARGAISEKGELENRGEQGESSEGREHGVELVDMQFVHQGDTVPHAYLCALPSMNATADQTKETEEPHDEPLPDAAASWRALSHLDGHCLYLRHRWFTYSYCHNREIRQFHEAPQTSLPPPEGVTPQEDPAHDSYTLGYAHPPDGKAAKGKGKRRKKGSSEEHDLAPEQTATFGVGPASRYLVQRWTDGTRCDKTGRPREVEVQVHCSMTSGDAIYMIKEVEICKYVVVIHSPHLCSLPGFRPQTADDVVPAPIRCREVMSDEDFAHWESAPREQEREILRIGERERAEAVQAAEDAAKARDTDTAKTKPKAKSKAHKDHKDQDNKVKVKFMDGAPGSLGDLEGVEQMTFDISDPESRRKMAEHIADAMGLGEELEPKEVEEEEELTLEERMAKLGEQFMGFTVGEDGEVQQIGVDDPNAARKALLTALIAKMKEELAELAVDEEEAEPEKKRGERGERGVRDEL